MASWSPSSWQSKPGLQMAEWEDKAAAAVALAKLGTLPPLVHPTEADRLKALLAEAGRGECFVVQGGDCAERFQDCEAGRLEAQLELITQIGLIVEHQSGTPTCCIARIAGQYGKPRSKPTEVVDGFGEIMSFKGENINGYEPPDRKWDPNRLVQGYFHSAAALNFLRLSRASADPAKTAAQIDLTALKPSAKYDEFVKAVDGIKKKEATRKEFFTSHEAMQLDLESALTRKVGDRYYNLSAHFVWIGDRTRQVDGAHVEYFSGISNPVGVKVGPSMKNDELKELLQKLNPLREEGRVMLITRYGAGKVANFLPGHIQAVKECGIPVTWQCDAVHGNGIVAPSNKYKTRRMVDILQEISEAMAVHKEHGSVLGGVHLEIEPTSCTEVLGGAVGISEEMLPTCYQTWCDPRLNYAQSIEAAFAVAAELPTAASPAKKARGEGA